MSTSTDTLIADFRATAEEIEARLAPSGCTVIASHNWIVIDDFGPLTFTVTPEGKKHRAAFWADAARKEAATLRRHIATLEAASAA